jgi:hypothetical protein
MQSSILSNIRDFFFFFIITHIEIYFIIHIVFLNVVHYKTLNTMLDL